MSSSGGWEPQGWQSQWQQQPRQPPQQGNWQQTPDGRWVQTGYGSNGKATAALVLGILGLVFCPFVCSIAALVLGYQARGEIDATGGMQGGRSNATAGVVLGWIGIALCLIAVLGFIALAAFVGDSGSTVTSSPS
jgi:ABC-type Fe3+ transport system permease subunit